MPRNDIVSLLCQIVTRILKSFASWTKNVIFWLGELGMNQMKEIIINFGSNAKRTSGFQPSKSSLLVKILNGLVSLPSLECDKGGIRERRNEKGLGGIGSTDRQEANVEFSPEMCGSEFLDGGIDKVIESVLVSRCVMGLIDDNEDVVEIVSSSKLPKSDGNLVKVGIVLYNNTVPSWNA